MKVFISYARSDDNSFVDNLVRELGKMNLTVWYDKHNMPSRALTFMEEIRRAIDDSDRLIIILGPAALTSDYVRCEWQYALTQSKVVIPLLRIGNYDDLPSELKDLHCPDCRTGKFNKKSLSEIKRILYEEIPSLGKTYGVPALPLHFQPRPQQFSRLTHFILRDQYKPVVSVGLQLITLLCGMGGSGKSVLASSFVCSSQVRRVFDNGIFWYDMRRVQNVNGLLNNAVLDLSQAFGKIHFLKTEDNEILKTTFRNLLENKRCLIVLDNISAQEEIESINDCIGTTSRLLVTTRETNLTITPNQMNVEGFTDQEAINLMTDWVKEDHPSEMKFIIEKCERLPFALAICGALGASGLPMKYIAQKLREADLTFLEKRFPGYPYPSVIACLDISIETLRQRNMGDVTRFHQLAVFAGGAAIPFTVIKMLWYASDFDVAEIRKLLIHFRDMTLLRMEGDKDDLFIHIHQLMHEYLRGVAGNIIGIHDTLVNAYSIICHSNFSKGPDDGYFFQNLIYHLLSAGRHNDAYSLLTESSKWHDTKNIRGVKSRGSYLNDANLAIAAIEDETGRLAILAKLFAARQVALKKSRLMGGEVLKALVLLDKKELAIESVNANIDFENKFTSFLTIGKELWWLHKPDDELIKEACTLLAAEKHDSKKQRMQLALLEYYTSTNEIEKALGIWSGISYKLNTSEELLPALLAISLIYKNKTDLALEIVSGLSGETVMMVRFHIALKNKDIKAASQLAQSLNGIQKDIAFSHLVRYLVSSKNLGSAGKYARLCEHQFSRINSLLSIPSNAFVEEAIELARNAEKLGDRATGLISCAETINRLQKYKRKYGFFKRAIYLFLQPGKSKQLPDAYVLLKEVEALTTEMEPSQRSILDTHMISLVNEMEPSSVAALTNKIYRDIISIKRVREKIDRLAGLSYSLSQLKINDKANEIIGEAIELSGSIGDPKQVEGVLCYSLPSLIYEKKFDIALSLASSIEEDRIKKRAFTLLSKALAQTEQYTLLEKLAVQYKGVYEFILLENIKSKIKNHLLSEATQLIKTLSSSDQYEQLYELTMTYAAYGLDAEASKTLGAFGDNENALYWKIRAYCELAIIKYNAGNSAAWEALLSEAENHIRFKSNYLLTLSLSRIAFTKAQFKKTDTIQSFEKAISSAQLVEPDTYTFLSDNHPEFEAWLVIASDMVNAGLFDEALALMNKFPKKDESVHYALRAYVTALLAAEAAKNNDREKALQLFEDALQAARNTENQLFGISWRSVAFQNVANQLAKAGYFKMAFSAAAEIHPTEDSFFMLMANWDEFKYNLNILTDVLNIFGWMRADLRNLLSRIYSKEEQQAG